VRALFPSSASFIHRTERGPNSLAELRRILQTERAQGWAEEAGMITEGLQSVAACAFDHAGRPVAAFSATRREDRPNTSLPALVDAVRGAARQLTQALSGRAPDGWF
jgi:IclR family acetate operon transcriptional repressor